MTKKELSVAEKLKTLYELQLIDSQVDEIQVFKGELPMEVSDLEDEIVGLETRINRLDESLADLKKENSSHAINIKESEALIERYETQLESVKNNREYDALSKEIQLQKLEIQLSEKKIGEVGKNLAAKEELLTTASERLQKHQEALAVKKVELEKIIEKTEKEEKSLLKKSDKAKAKIDERLMRAYNKIRSSYRNGLAVVNVSRNACGGCFNMIPPQVQLEIGLRKKIIVCEHCGRILVDDNILNVGVGEKA